MCTWRIGSARLVSMRKGAIDQCLIGKTKLWRPICCEPTGELIPLLIHCTRAGVAITVDQYLAWNVGKVLAVLSPTQSTYQLQLRNNLIIGFAKSGIGIEHIGVLAQKIVMAFIIQTSYWIVVEE